MTLLRRWRKAVGLRRKIGQHTVAALSLMHLTDLAIARNRVQKAGKYLQPASDEVQHPPDLISDDKVLYLETQGWLALAKPNASSATPACHDALALVQRSHGEEHWLTGWEHMLLGKADAQSGDLNSAWAERRKGLAILDHALGKGNLKYLVAKVPYSHLLDQIGLRIQAAQMRAAERARKEHYGNQCAGCTVSIVAFR